MSKTKTINFDEADNRTRYKILTSSVGPRPIAFASTVDKQGNVNLSPFSYFNTFSSTPPVLVFSPSRSGRDASTKNTYDNVIEVPEVVINIVNYRMVQQMSLTSATWDKGVNEFKKAGLTEVKSELVKPPRVKESPVSFECVVDDVIELGKEGGAGNLVISHVKMAHINEDYLDPEGYPDQVKLDLIGRMGGSWYNRANADSMFEVERPGAGNEIGVDGLPEEIRSSSVLTGNDLGKLGNLKSFPSEEVIKKVAENGRVKKVLTDFREDPDGLNIELHQLGKKMLDDGKIEEALALMMTVTIK